MGTRKLFPNERQGRRYLHPHVCFECRKSFKRPVSDSKASCSDCGRPLIALNRKFSAPKKVAKGEWEVVEYLVRAGFKFQSIELQDGSTAKYPKTMKEAISFVSKYQKTNCAF